MDDLQYWITLLMTHKLLTPLILASIAILIIGLLPDVVFKFNKNWKECISRTKNTHFKASLIVYGIFFISFALCGSYTNYIIKGSDNEKNKALLESEVFQYLFETIEYCNYKDFDKCQEDSGKRKQCFQHINTIKEKMQNECEEHRTYDNGKIQISDALHILKCKYEIVRKIKDELPKKDAILCTPKHKKGRG